MNHEELNANVATLPDVEPGFIPYLFQWASDGRPTAAFVTLVPHADGTVTATQGDLREKIEPVTDDAGDVRVFPDEERACEWAWTLLRSARRPAPGYTREQTARALLSAEAQRRRYDEAVRRATPHP